MVLSGRKCVQDVTVKWLKKSASSFALYFKRQLSWISYPGLYVQMVCYFDWLVATPTTNIKEVVKTWVRLRRNKISNQFCLEAILVLYREGSGSQVRDLASSPFPQRPPGGRWSPKNFKTLSSLVYFNHTLVYRFVELLKGRKHPNPYRDSSQRFSLSDWLAYSS